MTLACAGASAQARWLITSSAFCFCARLGAGRLDSGAPVARLTIWPLASVVSPSSFSA